MTDPTIALSPRHERVDLEKTSRAERAGIVETRVSNHSKPE
jgi:hypothetical protein